MAGVERFREAQNSSGAGFAAALREVQRGRKTGHWIWYVFPQIDGLGTSGSSQAFALRGEEETAEFLRDPELRVRLLTISRAVAEHVGRGKSLRALMGSEIDAKKVVSSLTLFGHVAKKLHEAEGMEAYGEMATVAEELLALAASQGYPPCAYTLRRVRGMP